MSANSPSLSSPRTATPTPATLLRHELNGLSVRVADAANDDAIGITGRVASETERTLIIENADERERQVPKGNAVFEFALAPTAADDESEDEERRAERTYVTVEGTRLIANPARRTERKRRSKWR